MVRIFDFGVGAVTVAGFTTHSWVVKGTFSGMDMLLLLLRDLVRNHCCRHLVFILSLWDHFLLKALTAWLWSRGWDFLLLLGLAIGNSLLLHHLSLHLLILVRLLWLLKWRLGLAAERDFAYLLLMSFIFTHSFVLHIAKVLQYVYKLRSLFFNVSFVSVADEVHV